MDTGADGSAITLTDAQKLGADITNIATPDRRRTTEGVGGSTDVCPIEISRVSGKMDLKRDNFGEGGHICFSL